MSYNARALGTGGVFIVAAIIFLISADAAPMAFMLAITGVSMSAMSFVLLHAMQHSGTTHSVTLPRWTPKQRQTARAATHAPRGVHLPPPSLLPIGICVAFAILFFGIAVNASFAVLGSALLSIALIGWFIDSRREWRAVVAAGRTGEISNPKPLRMPRLLLDAAAVLFLSLAIGQSGIFSQGSTSSATPTVDPLNPVVGASGIKFDVASISLKAGVETEMTFTNNDAGIPHNVAIREVGSGGAPLFSGEQITGIATVTYEIPPLTAGVAYEFFCELHANMIGTIDLE